jgi:hypothetical protein
MNGNWSRCYKCDSQMWLPQSLYEAAMAGKGTIVFYCAYGHGQMFAEGDSRETILRRERDRALQQIAERDDRIKVLDRLVGEGVKENVALRRNAKTMRHRVSNGVCPCCNRTFAKLAAHMKIKHPGFKAAPSEKIHDGERT